eukprot:c26548_g3_i1 orf=88-1119(-)
MSEFLSCFGEHGGRAPYTSDTSVASQNTVTCHYQTKLGVVSINWCKSLTGQGLGITVDDRNCRYTCKIDLKAWLFWKKQASKSIDVEGKNVEVFWDLSSAKYTCGPEPHECFYVAVVCDQEVVLLIGDLKEMALKRIRSVFPPIQAALLSRKEHVFGKKFYSTKAQFGDCDKTHDITIECHATAEEREPRLCVKVDRQVVVQVKRLMWKFRGNQKIQVDGLPIEVFWDVHNWLFNSCDGYAVFMFQTCFSNEKPWMREMEAPAVSAGTAIPSPLSQAAAHCIKDSNSHRGHWFSTQDTASPDAVIKWPSTLITLKGKESIIQCSTGQQGGWGSSFLRYARKTE